MNSVPTYSFLIIEDTKSHRDVYKIIINEVTKTLRILDSDVIVEEAISYRQALYKIGKKKYDVIILDKRMPGGDGNDLISRIHDKAPFQRIIFITAYPTDILTRQIKPSGIYAYLEKKGDYRNNLKKSLTRLLRSEIHCFIIMPYKKKYMDFYKKVIEPFISDLGFKPILAKDIFDKDTIIGTVRYGIKKSYFVIADLSEKNANVFYETGLSHQMNKPTIIITRSYRSIPSDLNGNFCFKYTKKNIDNFTLELKKRIQSIDAEYRALAPIYYK